MEDETGQTSTTSFVSTVSPEHTPEPTPPSTPSISDTEPPTPVSPVLEETEKPSDLSIPDTKPVTTVSPVAEETKPNDLSTPDTEPTKPVSPVLADALGTEPATPTKTPTPTVTTPSNTSSDNQTGTIESFNVVSSSGHSQRTKATRYGLIASFCFMAVLAVLVVGGIMKREGVFRRSWERVAGTNKNKASGKPPRGGGASGTKGKKSKAQETLHSLLGPGKFGFSRLRTYDSDSEMEEFPVFNRV